MIDAEVRRRADAAAVLVLIVVVTTTLFADVLARRGVFYVNDLIPISALISAIPILLLGIVAMPRRLAA
jgi:hypothetical protein